MGVLLHCLVAAVILAALATASIMCFLRAAELHHTNKKEGQK